MTTNSELLASRMFSAKAAGATFVLSSWTALFSLSLPERARWFPLIVGAGTSLSALTACVADLRRARRLRQELDETPDGLDEEQTVEETPTERVLSGFYWLMWIVAYFVAILLFGFLLSTGAWVGLFLRKHAQWPMWRILLGLSLVFAGILGLSELLALRWPSGYVWTWL